MAWIGMPKISKMRYGMSEAVAPAQAGG